MKKQVVIIIGAGGVGTAIARRQGSGKHIVLSDFNEVLLSNAAKDLTSASYTVSTQMVDVSDRASLRPLADKAASLGNVVNLVNTAGVSPNMAPPEPVLAVNLYGSAVVFEEFVRVIAQGGAGLIVSSMAGYMSRELPAEHQHGLAFAPADELLGKSFLGKDAIPDSMVAYIVSKKANHLRVQADAISSGKRGARVNSISPGIVAKSLAQYELNSPGGDIYRAMIEASPANRMASPDEVAVAAAYLLSPDAGFITGSDLLIDGGVIASMRAGLLPSPA